MSGLCGTSARRAASRGGATRVDVAAGFDDKILALYSRGLSTRDIEAHLAEIYGVGVGRDLVSRVTDAVMDDVREWQQRPLDDVYPVIFLDALVLKIREGGSVQRRACYLALRVTVEGEREVLGMARLAPGVLKRSRFRTFAACRSPVAVGFSGQSFWRRRGVVFPGLMLLRLKGRYRLPGVI